MWTGLALGMVLVLVFWFVARHYEPRPQHLNVEVVVVIGALVGAGTFLVAAVVGEATGSLAVMKWVAVLACDVYVVAMVLLMVFRRMRRREQ